MNFKKKKLGINEFYDISKFPAEPGITVVGISMSRIDKGQAPAKLFKECIRVIPKIKKPLVGDIMVYTDGLLMNSDNPASELKMKFQRLMEEHKRGYMKLIKKDIYLVQPAYAFTTWSQMILNCPGFHSYFEKLKEIYSKDKQFQKYVQTDITSANKDVNENTINYILEEVLLDYLVVKGKVRLQNDFVQDKEKWILNCYSGKPHRSHAYMHQKNFFKIRSTNVYQNSWYDLTNKKLYEFERMNIDNFDFSQPGQ
ncbi:hypothetical protein K9L16_00430 [Candidatus Pacearchaeota archaeon]|nr:hypothetical protein [Candidatus Pacearchaeota archaeon]